MSLCVDEGGGRMSLCVDEGGGRMSLCVDEGGGRMSLCVDEGGGRMSLCVDEGGGRMRENYRKSGYFYTNKGCVNFGECCMGISVTVTGLGAKLSWL